MIDLHSHILPGIDDGAESVGTSLAIARSAIADGVSTLAATPHVRAEYPTTPERMEELVAALRDALDQASIPLELLPGAEIALDVVTELEDDTLRRFGLGGNPGYLLIELADFGWPLQLEETLFRLRLRGFTTVLAHPERNSEVQEQPARLEHLVEAGTLAQLTAASIDGRLGPLARKTGLKLLELGLAHMLASDAHAPSVRQIGMSAAIAAIGDPELAAWLTTGVPGAIVDGTALPRVPPALAVDSAYHGLVAVSLGRIVRSEALIRSAKRSRAPTDGVQQAGPRSSYEGAGEMIALVHRAIDSRRHSTGSEPPPTR